MAQMPTTFPAYSCKVTSEESSATISAYAKAGGTAGETIGAQANAFCTRGFDTPENNPYEHPIMCIRAHTFTLSPAGNMRTVAALQCEDEKITEYIPK